MMNEKTKKTTVKMRQEPKRKKIKVSRILIHALLLLLVFINIFPLYWMLTFSLKNNNEIQGYGYYGKSYWDEVSESIEKGTGNRIEIAWNMIDMSIINSAKNVISSDPLDPDVKTQPYREKVVERILEKNWDSLKASLYAIDGFYNEEKTDDDWNRIKDEAVEIINTTITEGIREHAEQAEKEGPVGGADATEEEKQIAALGVFDYSFSFSRKKWPDFKSGVNTIVELQEPDSEVVWATIRQLTEAAAAETVQKDKDLDDEGQAERQQKVQNVLDLQWENIKASILAIDTISNPIKTEADWNDSKEGIRAKIESIIAEPVKQEIQGQLDEAKAEEDKTAWLLIERVVFGSAESAVGSNPVDPNVKTQPYRETVITRILEEKWAELKASLSAIDGFLNAEKTDEDWDQIKAEATEIIHTTITAGISEYAVRAEMEGPLGGADATEEEKQIAALGDFDYTFSFTEKKWPEFKTAVDIIAEPAPVFNFDFMYADEDWNEVRSLLTPKDPWAKVGEALVDVLGDDAKKLNDRPRILVPPNRIGLPETWAWENYPGAIKTGNIVRNFVNSLVVSASTIIITIMAAFMATYAMTRLVWKGRKTMNKFFMLGLTIPIHAAIVPVYIILSRIHWLDTYQALIIPYSAFSLAMAILISVGFMGDIPYDLDEAAFLDGCGIWGIFFRVIVPLMMPAVATVGIYTFLQCWNELLFATIFVSKGAYKTLPVGMQEFVGQYTTDWGRIGAGLSIATIPTLIVYVALSKRIQAGFIAGAVKG